MGMRKRFGVLLLLSHSLSPTQLQQPIQLVLLQQPLLLAQSKHLQQTEAALLLLKRMAHRNRNTLTSPNAAHAWNTCLSATDAFATATLPVTSTAAPVLAAS